MNFVRNAVGRLLSQMIAVFVVLASSQAVFAQADAPAAASGKSYATGYLIVFVVVAVALILICKSAGRAKELGFQKDED